MQSEKVRFGEMLRKKREEKKLSLKEVENLISIRARYLQAIEEGSISTLLSGVYALGFTKQYAGFLEFDVDKLMKEHPAAFQVQTHPHDFSYGIGTLEMRGSLAGGVKWLPKLLWAVGSIFVFILAYYFFRAVGA